MATITEVRDALLDAVEGLVLGDQQTAEITSLRFQSGHATVVWTGSGLAFNERWLAVEVDGETVVGQLSTLAEGDTADAIASLQGSATLPADGTETTAELRDSENGSALWTGTLTWGTSGARRGFATGGVSYGDLDPTEVAVGGMHVSAYGYDGANVTTPAVVVLPADPWWGPVLTMGPTENARRWRWQVLCHVAQQDPASSFNLISDLVEAVNTALRADPKLGGVVPYQSVTEISEPYQDVVSEADVLTVQLLVEVVT